MTPDPDYLEAIAKKLLFDLSFVAPESTDVQLHYVMQALQAATTTLRVERDEAREALGKCKLAFDDVKNNVRLLGTRVQEMDALEKSQNARAEKAELGLASQPARERELVRHLLRESNIDSWIECKGVRPEGINLEACEPREDNVTNAIYYFERQSK